MVVGLACIALYVAIGSGDHGSALLLLTPTRVPSRNGRPAYNSNKFARKGGSPADAGDGEETRETNYTMPPNTDQPIVLRKMDCLHHDGACVQEDGSVILPHGYPVHRFLPLRSDLHAGLNAQRSKKCPASSLLLRSPLINSAPQKKGDPEQQQQRHAKEASMRQALERQFETPLRSDKSLFFSDSDNNNNNNNALHDSDSDSNDEDGPWWIPFSSSSDQAASLERLPCTAEVQALLHRWQQPPKQACTATPFHDTKNNNHDNDPDLGQAGTVRGLVSQLKAGAHGVGSAITLLAHDFLSALLLRRRFAVAAKKPWYFAPAECGRKGGAAAGGWECLFLPPTSCQAAWGSVPSHSISSISRVPNKRLVTKKSFDATGLSRSDFPSMEAFFAILTSQQDDEVRSLPQARHESIRSGDLQHDTLVSGILIADGRRSADREKQIAAKCVPLVREWASSDTSNRILMGTFRKGSDPLLVYQLAQVTAYLMRGLQPWFRQVIAAHLRRIVLANPSRQQHLGRKRPEDDEQLLKSGRVQEENAEKAAGVVLGRGGGGDQPLRLVHDPAAEAAGQIEEEVRSVVFVHDRGELAKYREYYNTFGCHKLAQDAYLRELNLYLCPPASAENSVVDIDVGAEQQQKRRMVKQNKCIVFISGNMPQAEYQQILKRLEPLSAQRVDSDGNNFQLIVRSTWRLTAPGSSGNKNAAVTPAEETARWGAAHPAASWVDLFAGMHSTAWTCVVQSNWCRVIDFLRMTLLSRAHCPFIDMGIAALADDAYPNLYCIVREDWPKKPYGGTSVVKNFVVK